MNLRQLQAAYNRAGRRLNKAGAEREELTKALREAEAEENAAASTRPRNGLQDEDD